MWGNEQADRLAAAAPLDGKLLYFKADTVKALWDQTGCASYLYLERLIQRGISRGSERYF